MRATILLLLAAVCALLAAQAARPAGIQATGVAPPALAGEALGNRGSAGSANGHCNPSAASQLSWDVSGAATGFDDLAGPYPGTFHQNGFFVLGSFDINAPGDTASAPMQAYGSRFTIDSQAGRVSGTTTFVHGSDSAGGCSVVQGFFGGVAHFHYQAIIRSNGWLCQTTGTGTQAVNAIPGTVAEVDVAFETTDTFNCHALG